MWTEEWGLRERHKREIVLTGRDHTGWSQIQPHHLLVSLSLSLRGTHVVSGQHLPPLARGSRSLSPSESWLGEDGQGES